MYTQAFKEAVAYCKANNLFVGYGNPNGKVLVIGKEAAHIPQEETTKNLEKKSKKQNSLQIKILVLIFCYLLIHLVKLY